MTHKTEGEYPPVYRVVTPYWSLNRALSGTDRDGNVKLGFPMTIIEIFGMKGVGKSTIATSFAGVIAEHFKKDIVYAPVEHIDRDLMDSVLDSVKFDGTVTILGGKDMVKKFLPELKMKKEEMVTDEILGDCFVEALRRDEYVFGIFDSLTMVSPLEEMESSSADKNMGRRARLSGVWVRQILQSSRFRENGMVPCTVFITHNSTPMGGGTPTNTGTTTSGGEAKKNASKARIKLRKLPEATMNDQEENAYVVEGTVEQFNFGKDKRKFHLVVLGGKGIHEGLTAMYDCKMLGLCTFGASITLGTTKFGRMASIIEKAHEGDDKFFEPFIEALKNPSKIEKPKKDETDDDIWIEDAE